MPSSDIVSTKRQRIAKLAQEAKDMSFTSLSHHIDLTWLREAYSAIRKNAAPGVDGQTAQEYEKNLERNLQVLLNRFKSGTYRAPPVRRAYIPKGKSGETRPLGIPTLEDRVLQKAVTWLLESVYEQDFCACSYGYRPKRSAHQALQQLRDGLMEMGGGYVIEVDVRKFFENLDHSHLRSILSRRVRDGLIVRMIGKWLKAGVLEGHQLSHPEAGTPQGGVISPLLANVYLHDVLDVWFAEQVQPIMRGRSLLVRYADDFVLAFEKEEDARRVWPVLPKRFGKYGLTLHPKKTRLLRYDRPRRRSGNGCDDEADDDRGSFDFLGFTHYWALSRHRNWVIKRKTAKDRFSRTVRNITNYLRAVRHCALAEQQEGLRRRLQGHYNYFGITGNSPALSRVHRAVERQWFTWLNRRSQRSQHPWAWFTNVVLRFFPLPRPIAVHSTLRLAARP